MNTEDSKSWEELRNKKKCPDCGGVNEKTDMECRSCGWSND